MSKNTPVAVVSSSRISLISRVQLLIVFVASLLVASNIYSLYQFNVYEAAVSKLYRSSSESGLSGKQRDDSIFIEKLFEAILVDPGVRLANSVDKEHFYKNVELVKLRSLNELGTSNPAVTQAVQTLLENKFTVMDDSAGYLRSIQNTAFLLYRTCWNQKWMRLATVVGSFISEINNISDLSTAKQVKHLETQSEKLKNTIEEVLKFSTLSLPSQQLVNGQIALISSEVEKIRNLQSVITTEGIKRKADVKAIIQLFNDHHKNSGKTRSAVLDNAQWQVMLGFVLFLLSVLCALIITIVWSRSWRHRFEALRLYFAQQSNSVIDQAATNTPLAFETTDLSFGESELWVDYVNNALAKITEAREVDSYIRKGLSVGVAIIENQSKLAYWNASFSNLSLLRGVDDLGAQDFTSALSHLKPVEGGVELNRLLEQASAESRPVAARFMVVASDAVQYPVEVSLLKVEHQAVSKIVMQLRNANAEHVLDREKQAALDAERVAIQAQQELLSKLNALGALIQDAGVLIGKIDNGVGALKGELVQRPAVLGELSRERLSVEQACRNYTNQVSTLFQTKNQLSGIVTLLNRHVAVTHELFKKIEARQSALNGLMQEAKFLNVASSVKSSGPTGAYSLDDFKSTLNKLIRLADGWSIEFRALLQQGTFQYGAAVNDLQKVNHYLSQYESLQNALRATDDEIARSLSAIAALITRLSSDQQQSLAQIATTKQQLLSAQQTVQKVNI